MPDSGRRLSNIAKNLSSMSGPASTLVKAGDAPTPAPTPAPAPTSTPLQRVLDFNPPEMHDEIRKRFGAQDTDAQKPFHLNSNKPEETVTARVAPPLPEVTNPRAKNLAEFTGSGSTTVNGKVPKQEFKETDLFPPQQRADFKFGKPEDQLIPSLANYNKNKANNRVARYPETLDPGLDSRDLKRGLLRANPFKQGLDNIHARSPEDRAYLGMHVGGAAGAQYGAHQTVIGAAVGALAGRARGVVQSGEYEESVKRDNVGKALQSLGVIKEGKIRFSDGGTFDIGNMSSLRNTSSFLSGKRDRKFYETDITNPFTKRAAVVARPMARYLVQGMMGDISNPEKNKVTIDQTAGILTNMAIHGARSIQDVYARLAEVNGSFGVDRESMASFLESRQADFGDGEADEIRQGLGVLYA